MQRNELRRFFTRRRPARTQAPPPEYAWPFQTLDDTAFLESTQRGRPSRVVRGRAGMHNRFVNEERIANAVGIRGRYDNLWRFTLRLNEFSIRTNIRMVYDRMVTHIRPQHRYRIRIVESNRERLVRNRSGITVRGIFTSRQFLEEETFDLYVYLKSLTHS